MKLIISILFFSTLNICYSQQMGNSTLKTTYLDSNNSIINIETDVYYGSSVFKNYTINKFLYGGFIDDKEKKDILDRTKRLNYIGGEFNSSIYYSNPKTHLIKNWGIYTKLSYNYNIGTQFTRDAYILTFIGNKHKKGEQSILSQSAFYNRDMKSFSFGLNKFNKTKIGITISSLANNTRAEVIKSTTTTSNTGDEIYLYINGNYSSVDTNSKTTFFSHNALGIGVDFEKVIKIKEEKNSQRIFVGVKNVGILHQNKSYKIWAKREYTYEGIEVTNINQISKNLLSSQSLQDSIGLKQETSSKTSLSPFEIYFYQVPSYTKTIELIYGFRYKNISAYKAFLYLGGNIMINKKINISTYISHGGYSDYKWGISSNIAIKKIRIGVNTANILGLISNNFYGKSLGLSISYLI